MIIKEFELSGKPATQNIDVGGNMPVGFSATDKNGKLTLFIQLEEDYPGKFIVDISVVKTEQRYEKMNLFAGTVVMSDGKVYHVFTNINYIRAEDL